MTKERKSRKSATVSEKNTPSVSQEESAQPSHANPDNLGFSPDLIGKLCEELRSPLNLAMELADLLKGSHLTGDQIAGVNVIRNANQSVLDRLNDLSTIAQVEAGKLSLDILDFDLLKLVEHATETSTERALEKGILVTRFVDPAIAPVLKGDSQRLRQILSNLTANTLLYKSHGSIFVKVAPDASEGDESKITFTVTDTGSGLSQQEINWLAQPLHSLSDAGNFQADVVSHIGMRVAKCLIESMGGTFWVTGIAGKGTTIGFTLALATGTDLTERHQILKLLKDKRILFANVEEIQLSILQQFASSYGVRHFAITNVEHVPLALQNATASGDPYMLAVVDLSGDERGKSLEPLLLRLLRQSETPIVFLRDIDDPESEIDTLQYTDQLFMPVKQSDFVSCLVNFLPAATSSSRAHDVLDNDASNASTTERIEKEQVLLVDDNRVNREIAKLLLNKLGYQSTLVTSGAKALEEIAQQNFAFVLIDCMMPDMDGFETARRIREAEKDKNYRHKLIAVTASPREGDEAKAKEAGMDDFIAKPVTADKLSKVIGKWHSF
ncbi:MAG: response regulator [Candidatus Obscuribacterales bacterium]|nr:response regulator [Candidatus Obscuribacterales bacterium]